MQKTARWATALAVFSSLMSARVTVAGATTSFDSWQDTGAAVLEMNRPLGEESAAREIWQGFGYLGFTLAFAGSSASQKLQMSSSGGLLDTAFGLLVWDYVAAGIEGSWLMFDGVGQNAGSTFSLYSGGIFAGLRSPPLITEQGGFRLGANVGRDWLAGSRSWGDTTCYGSACSQSQKESVDIGGGAYAEAFVAFGFAQSDRPWVGGIALAYREYFGGGLTRSIALNFGVF